MLDALLFTKSPKWLRALYPECIWKIDTEEKVLYLTFDDGPIPEITPFVLDELKKWKAKATFFCIGKNVGANPEIFKRIKKEGHRIGNHTFDHLSGWKYSNKIYFSNIEKCENIISTNIQHSTLGSQQLFRPPYGKLKISQYKNLKEHYKLILWDVLTFDFDIKTSKERVLKATLKHSGPGSIIVFHDSLKAAEKVKYALPKVLEHFTQLGYKFNTIK